MNRKNLILGIILIILIALAWAYNGPYEKWKDKKGRPDNFFEKIDTDKINKVEVTSGGKTTVLTKAGEKWRIEGLKNIYAGAENVSMMVEKLKQAKTAQLELSSANKDKKADFQTDSTGAEVKLYEGENAVLDFIVGRMGSDYSSSYIALPNADNTYLVRGVNLNAAFAGDDWADKTVFNADSTKINKIRFQIKGKEFIIEKKGENWEGTKPNLFKVDKEKAEKAVAIMSSLTAVKVPEQKFEGTGLEKNSIIAQATGEGIDNTIMVGGQDKDKLFYAKTGASDAIYLISADDKSVLDTSIDKLK